MICPKCGDNNEAGTFLCKGCGEYLPSQPEDNNSLTPVQEPRQDTYQQMPYRNSDTQPGQPDQLPRYGEYQPPRYGEYQPPRYGEYQPPAKKGDPQKNKITIIGFCASLALLLYCFLPISIPLQNDNELIFYFLFMLAVSITTFVLNIKGTKSQKVGLAIAGLVISILQILMYGFVLFGVLLAVSQ